MRIWAGKVSSSSCNFTGSYPAAKTNGGRSSVRADSGPARRQRGRRPPAVLRAGHRRGQPNYRGRSRARLRVGSTIRRRWWCPYSSGARIHASDAPPTRKSISALGEVNPAAPHHRITYSGSLQALHTSSTVASKILVTTTAKVLLALPVSLSGKVISLPFARPGSLSAGRPSRCHPGR